MPGGLEGRFLRERIKAQRLQNMQSAMNMTRPTAMLEDAYAMERLQGARSARRNTDAMIPHELKARVLNNEMLDSQLAQAAFKQRYMQEDREAARADRAALRENQTLQNLISLASAGGYQYDNRDALNEVMAQAGLSSQLQERPNPMAAFMPQAAPVDEDAQRKMELLESALKNIGEK